MATKPTLKVIDTTNPLNVGVDFTGITVAANAATVQGAGERKVWTTHASISPLTCPDNVIPSRIAIVTSTGAATPATVTGYVETLKNGNWLVLATRDAIPAPVKALRAAVGAESSAAWKAAKALKAATPAPVKAVAPAPVVPTLASAPVVVAPAPVAVAPAPAIDDDDLADYTAWKAAKVAQAAAQMVASQAPTVPTVAPKVPRKK
jgi:hypothetical protein